MHKVPAPFTLHPDIKQSATSKLEQERHLIALDFPQPFVFKHCKEVY